MIEIYKALAGFQEDCPVITLDSNVEIKMKPPKTGVISFSFASLGNIVKTIQPTLTKHGLGFFHQVSDKGVKCTIFHSSGEAIEGEYFKLAAGSDAKAQGAAITYSRRYTLVAALGLFAEDDNDTNRTDGSGRKQMSEKLWGQALDRITDGDQEALIKTLLYFDLNEDQINKLIESSFQVRSL